MDFRGRSSFQSATAVIPLYFPTVLSTPTVLTGFARGKSATGRWLARECGWRLAGGCHFLCNLPHEKDTRSLSSSLTSQRKWFTKPTVQPAHAFGRDPTPGQLGNTSVYSIKKTRASRRGSHERERGKQQCPRRRGVQQRMCDCGWMVGGSAYARVGCGVVGWRRGAANKVLRLGNHSSEFKNLSIWSFAA